MKYLLITVSFVVLAVVPGFSVTTPPDSLVLLGNKAYNENKFQQAEEYYLAVINQGLASPELYYNLGNAYFKMNDMPSAILYYEKALKLHPKDEDINFNLNLANSRIIDKIEPVPVFFLWKWWKQILNVMSPDQWAKTGIAFFIIFLFFFSVFLVSRMVTLRKISFWTGLLVFVLTLFTMTVGFQTNRSMKKEREGIIFTPTVTVKSSPSENSVDLFVIHEGTKVQILDNLENWTEIKIANGSVGWLKKSDYKSI